MTDLQENKLSAYEATDKILNSDEYKAIWSSVPYFGQLVATLHTLIDDIHALSLTQEKNNSGAAIEKKETRISLENAIIKVCNAGVACAIFSDDHKLKESLAYTPSRLRLSRDNDLAAIADTVYGIAYPLRQSLLAYHLSEHDITTIAELKDQFLQMLAAPRAAKVESKNTTAALKIKFAEADALLSNKIDQIIKIFKPDHPDFVEQYFHARIIINLGVRHTGLKVARINGVIFKAGTSIPLPDARVSINRTKRHTNTDATGKFSFFFRINATYTLQVELEGYQRYTTEAITIKPGDLINLKIELEPNE